VTYLYIGYCYENMRLGATLNRDKSQKYNVEWEKKVPEYTQPANTYMRLGDRHCSAEFC
jgi:DNA transposition AAA+ family ATPase